MKLSELIEKVQSTDTEVVITKNGRPAAVLVSPDEFEGWRNHAICNLFHMVDDFLFYFLV